MQERLYAAIVPTEDCGVKPLFPFANSVINLINQETYDQNRRNIKFIYVLRAICD